MFSHYLTLREQHGDICQVILVYLNTTTVKKEKGCGQQFPHPLLLKSGHTAQSTVNTADTLLKPGHVHAHNKHSVDAYLNYTGMWIMCMYTIHEVSIYQ